jgi:hypothetical protein
MAWSIAAIANRSLEVGLYVPKSRFCNIDGEGRQGQVVRRRRRGAQSRDEEGRPCSEIDESSTHYNRRHIRVAFCQGDRGAIGWSRMPIARIRCKKTGPYEVSRSRIRYRGAWSHGNASVTRREIQSAVGFAVTPNDTQSRRPWRTMTRQYRIWNAIVGRTKRSIAAIPSA